MKTYKQKAEEYVREKCPELMEWSIVSSGRAGVKDGRASKPTIQLQHWLTALNLPPNSKIENYTDNRFGVYTGKARIFFDRTSGQPATEADYQAFCEIVGVC